jgi:hypothetical protein
MHFIHDIIISDQPMPQITFTEKSNSRVINCVYLSERQSVRTSRLIVHLYFTVSSVDARTRFFWI